MFVLIGAALLIGQHAHHAGTSSAADPSRHLERYVAAAVEAHPTLSAVRKTAAATRKRGEASASFMDPVFMIAANNVPVDSFSFNRTPMTGVRLGLTQRFPWPGKLGGRQAVFEAQARVLEERNLETANGLASQVRRIYYDIHFIDASTVVVKENLEILAGFIEIAETKYQLGNALQQDVLRARLARDHLAERALQLSRARAHQTVLMHELTGLSEEIPSLVAVPVFALPRLDAKALEAAAVARRPELAALAAEASAKTAIREREIREAYPDFSVGVAYTIRGDAGGRDPAEGSDFLSLQLGVTLPVFSVAQHGDRAEAAVLGAAAIGDRTAAALRKIRRAIARAVRLIPELDASMALYRDAIVPNAKLTLDADRIGYQVGKSDFLALLDSEMRLIQLEVEFHRLHVEREKLIVDLAEAIGIAPVGLVNLRAGGAQ